MKTFRQFLEATNNPFGLRTQAEIDAARRAKNAEVNQQNQLKDTAIQNRNRVLAQQKARFEKTAASNENKNEAAQIKARNRRTTFKSL